jgi:uncharacterized protein
MYGANAMSIRSFRDRYGALGQQTETSAADSHDALEWPLPERGTLLSTSFGHTVVCDSVFSGDDIDLARLWLVRAGITRDIDSTVFVDTETTGLSGGTGTHVFLVGLGRFEARGFVVRQYFLRHPGEERALLSAIERDVRDAGCLVTYNGRSFDVPMLETRFRMHHQSFAFPDHHLDLLHPVRSLWKHRLPGCSLGTVERDILGVTRVDDAPGWMIPQMYFSYLQSRRIEMLASVFSHNQQDIVSLARIAGLVHAYQAGIESPEHPADRLCVALLRLRMGDVDDALSVIIQESGSALVPGQIRLRAARAASTALKRARRYHEALDLWQRGLNDPARSVRSFAAEEIAKHLEHRVRDHQGALEIARSAADGARLAGDTDTARSFAHRIVRLEEKIRRAGTSSTAEEKQENV